MNTRRIGLRLVNVLTMVAALAGAVAATPAQADPATLFVGTGPSCSDLGSGTADRPFCTVQAAANVANPGQQVQISGSHAESVFINRSGAVGAPIVFDGVHRDETSIRRVGGLSPTVFLSGVHDVEIRNLTIFGATPADAVLVDVSDRITIDRNAVTADLTTEHPPGSGGVHVSGGSSHVTISRNKFTVFGQSVRVDDSSNVTVAGNDISQGPNGGITIVRAQNAAITGNTVLEPCNRGIEVRGASAGTSVQNNIVAFPLGASASSYCSPVQSHGISVEVATGVTLDYNIVYTRVPRPYLWAGLVYASKDDLRAATGQGANDLNVDPTVGSPAVDSANADAPGELPDDINGGPRVDNPMVPNTGTGANGYHDRGALEAQDSFQDGLLRVSASRAPVGGQVTVSGNLTDAWSLPFTCAVDFGDGTRTSVLPCSSTHAYSATGTYTINVTATNDAHLTRSATWQITIVPAGSALEPSVAATQFGALSAQLEASAGSDPWDIASTAFDYGDGIAETVPGNRAFHRYDRPGRFTVRATITDAGGNTASATTVFTTQGSAFVAFGPARFLDTRNGLGTGTAQPVAPFGTVRLAVGGTAGIPAGITAVVMNVTVTNPAAGGFGTVYPDGASRPEVSNLNFTSGRTVPNVTMVPVGSNGFIDLFNGSPGTTDLIADVTGYYTQTDPGVAYQPFGVFRIFDTRTGEGTDTGARGPVPAGGVLTQTVAGGAVKPPLGATAVALNVTVTNPQAPGWVTVYPNGANLPVASNLNYAAGQDIANSVIVPIGADGKINFFTSATTDLIADISGYFIAGSRNHFVPVAPVRKVDTRDGTGQAGPDPVPARSPRPFHLLNGIPGTGFGAVAVAYNATVVNPRDSGFLTAFATSDFIPVASNLNFVAGSIVPNLVITQLSQRGDPNGDVSFYNGSNGSLDVIADVSGYFAEY
jgi:parallel beta-helix repeat protein